MRLYSLMPSFPTEAGGSLCLCGEYITERWAKEKEKREELRNDKIIIPSISVTDIIFDGILGEWNYKPFPK